MKQIGIISILLITAFSICGCSSASLQSENESLRARLAEVESEYADYKQLMQEYDGLAGDELKVRKFQAEEQRKYIEAVEESKAIQESKQREAEEKKGYDIGITFSNLNREPDNYKGQKVKFYGRVLQVLEGKNEVDIRLATKKFSIGNSYSSGSSSLDNLSYMEDIVYAYYDPKTSNYRILEGDMITIYGIAKGLYTYTSTENIQITLPLIEVEKIDLKEY